MINLDVNKLNQWARLGPRAMFGNFMLELGKSEKNLIVLSADLGRSSGLDRFKIEFPEKYVSVGICEQNLIGVASGLAKEGFKVFVTSFAPFLSMRASEQIRMNLGYMKIPVNIVALGSGLSMGFLGNSHYGLEDISVMRTIPGLNISSPADTFELGKILNDYVSNNRGPSYIRLTGAPGFKSVYEKDYKYEFKKLSTIKKGNDILVLSTGSVVSQCKISAENLKKNNIDVELVNIHTIKPLSDEVFNLIKKFNKIVVVEEHTIVGGLYSSILEIMHQKNINSKIKSISLPNTFGPTGDYNFLLNYHGLVSEKISEKIIKFFKTNYY